MVEWIPGEGDSPDRVDALVHGAKELNILSHVNTPLDLAEGTSFATMLNKKNPYAGMDITHFKDPY
jgi:hypothetical protein